MYTCLCNGSVILCAIVGSRQQDQKMVESFKVALDCWDFLQSNITYRGGCVKSVATYMPPYSYFCLLCLEFSRLCQQWGAFEWAWLSSFRTDMAIYKVLCIHDAVANCHQLLITEIQTNTLSALLIQGDHALAMQILQHEWHKIKEEDKSNVS